MIDFNSVLPSGIGAQTTIPKTVNFITPAGIDKQTFYVNKPLDIDSTDDFFVNILMQTTLDLVKNNNGSRETSVILLNNCNSGGADGKSVLEITFTPRKIRDGEWDRVEFLVRRNKDVSADTIAIYYVDYRGGDIEHEQVIGVVKKQLISALSDGIGDLAIRASLRGAVNKYLARQLLKDIELRN